MQEINTEIQLKKKKKKRENMEKIDIIKFQKKKTNQKLKEYQKNYREANKTKYYNNICNND